MVYSFLISILSELSLGAILAIVLMIWMVAETMLILLSNPRYMLDTFGSGELSIVNQVESYASKALTFASLTFAGLTFVLAQFLQKNMTVITDTIFLFTVGFGLFILSYKMEVYGATRRIYWNIQQRLFNFGILSLVLGFSLFFENIYGKLAVFIELIAVLMIILHVLEYYGDYKEYANASNHEGSKQTSLQDY